MYAITLIYRAAATGSMCLEQETKMNSQPSKPEEPNGFNIDTDTFAAKQGVKGQSVRSRVCRFGNYFGITPKKLANGRLLWPDVQVSA